MYDGDDDTSPVNVDHETHKHFNFSIMACRVSSIVEPLLVDNFVRVLNKAIYFTDEDVVFGWELKYRSDRSGHTLLVRITETTLSVKFDRSNMQSLQTDVATEQDILDFFMKSWPGDFPSKRANGGIGGPMLTTILYTLHTRLCRLESHLLYYYNTPMEEASAKL